MYGHLYADNTPGGQSITIVSQNVFVGLTHCTAGVAVGLITDVADAAGDNLEVPVGGAGDYEIIYHVCIPYVLSKAAETTILKNGSALAGTASFAWVNDAAAIAAVGAGACGIFTLAEGDEIAIGVANATDTNNLNYYTAHLTMKRIGR
jgi:hypothetical protein